MADSVANLTVHGVGKAGRALEPGEDRTWVTITQFEQVLDTMVGRTDVQLTFDDGNASDLEIALPRLLERGLTAEFFVLAGCLGEPGRLDAAGVRELAAAGMRIGSHGWAHRDWRRIDDGQAVEEMIHARRVLEKLTGQGVCRVAIPFGSYDRHVLRRLKQVKAARVYTSDGGRARSNSWLQPRTSLHHGIGPEWTRQLIDGKPSTWSRTRGLAARTVKRLRG